MFKNILVPTDGSRLSVKAVKHAVKLAKSLGAKITGFYAAPDLGSTYYGDGYILRAPSAKVQAEFADKQARKCLSAIEVEAAVEKVPCEVFHVVSDSPYEAIIDAAKKKKCDLIRHGAGQRNPEGPGPQQDPGAGLPLAAGCACALRAPTVSSARIKTIRAENTVMDKNKDRAGVLYKIVDCTRMAIHPCAIDDPRGRLLVRATSQPYLPWKFGLRFSMNARRPSR